jgi:lysophospholipase L1-like esterase
MIIFDRIGVRARQHNLPLSTALKVIKSKASMMTSEIRHLNILCYGDSLTAGTSPPQWQEYPYAPSLERKLAMRFPSVHVRHKGLPGWTAHQMVQQSDGPHGLATLIRLQNQQQQQSPLSSSTLSIVIILAGTNDLAYSEDVDAIFQSIVALHKLAWQNGILNTIAIGIPPSGYQHHTPSVADVTDRINQKLKLQQTSSPMPGTMMTYVAFPFSFPSEESHSNGNIWAPDGLHLSPQGYDSLGDKLATILQDEIIPMLLQNPH